MSKLHIGGKVKADGWWLLDIAPGPHVDFVGDCRDLSRFGDNSLEAIYASHVLEHIGFREVTNVLKEWFRALAPGGSVHISVPDLSVLCRLFVRPEVNSDQRNYILQVMFGAQLDEYDVHRTGFYGDLLAGMLMLAGFSEIRKVDSFGLFLDSSEQRFLDSAISLNISARK